MKCGLCVEVDEEGTLFRLFSRGGSAQNSCKLKSLLKSNNSLCHGTVDKGL